MVLRRFCLRALDEQNKLKLMTRLKRRKEDDGCISRPFSSILFSVKLFLIIVLLLPEQCNAFEEHRCKTLDIRNSPTMRAYPKGTPKERDVLNCTVLEGSFLMTMITHTNLTESSFPTFKHLREITGSLLIYQVRGLKSLRWLFPNLRVVGGQQLIQHYSVIIYQNEDLEELGLDNLHVIRNGGIRITDNTKLCNAETIDWKRLQYGPINDVLVDDASAVGIGEGEIAPCENRCDSEIRLLSRNDPRYKRCYRTNNTTVASCWGSSCQDYCEFDRVLDEKNISISGPGCVNGTWNVPCHELCIGGCWKVDDPSACFACSHISHEGRCIEECPPHLFEYQGRRCINRTTCEAFNDIPNRPEHRELFKAFHRKCSQACPEGYEEDPSNTKTCRRCLGECLKKCDGNVVIDSLARAKHLERCTYIEGYLEIEMRIGMDAVPAEELTKAFSRIKVIDGYLLIRLSTAFVNLHMFKSLTTITGSQLYRKKYSVAVYENPNLQKLFNPDSHLNITTGYLQFQNNRMLCFQHIERLMKSLGREKEMDDFDQSKNSNGDKAICEESTFEVSVANVLSSAFSLKWEAYDMTDIDYRKFLGYEVLYKEVPAIDPNLSIDDDRSACSDSWNSYFQEVKTSVDDDARIVVSHRDQGDHKNKSSLISEGDYVYAMISNDYIKPNTIYAYYVKTSMVRHEGAKNAISKIGFLKTLFGVPDPPKITNSVSKGTEEIEIEWDPPIRPNGEITYYIISYRPTDVDVLKKAAGVCDVVNTGKTAVQSGKADNNGSTMAPNAQSVLLSTMATPADTCLAKGCCACGAGQKDEVDPESVETEFENAVQNMIFVQNCDFNWDPSRCDGDPPEDYLEPVAKRKRREVAWERRRQAIYRSPHPIRNTYLAADVWQDEEELKRAEQAEREKAKKIADYKKRVKRSILSNPFDKDHSNLTSLSDEIAQNEHSSASKAKKIRVTGTVVRLKNLTHFTSYFISITACQNESVEEHHCSARKAWTTVSTESKEDADLIDGSSIKAEVDINGTTSLVNITWDSPRNPNGAIIGYKIKVTNLLTQATPNEKCESILTFSPESGYIFTGLTDGDYSLEIQSISLLGISLPATAERLFTVRIPGFWTWKRILITSLITLIVLVIIGLLVFYFGKKYYGKKMKDIANQIISANPEYLSQNDVYNADHWEIHRSQLTLQEEIGKGTFGKVYRGYGHHILSVCGESFGPCAIKTVAEGASNAERIHFLMEASVMKQFQSSFIVKLYGVVSDGQPVLVVMEMMEKGNLRDYLRSRRKGADENVDNLPEPTIEQFYEWAAQIADGMSYLESIRFCHRDLAARNCMVHADETVKIGDFGMARDLYYHEYYKPTGKRLMPVRWMAPESLKDGRFDTKSDVWAYGIVLYEMWTLGQQPYMGLANDEVLNFIGMHRKILDRPVDPLDCPDFWYELMSECWKYQPKDRPSFVQIVRHLLDFTSERFKELSFVCANPNLCVAEDEPVYVPEGHGIRNLEIAENEDAFVAKNNRAAHDEPDWGENDMLAGGDNVAEHEV